MAVKNLQNIYAPPKEAPGKDVALTLGRVPIMVQADQIVASAISGAVTVQLFKVPNNAMIVDIVMRVKEALSAGVTAQIGDGNDTDRFIAAHFPQVGSFSMKQSGQPESGGGYIYSDDDTVDIKFSGASTTGTIDVFMQIVFDPLLD